jgi:hypothetical protein
MEQDYRRGLASLRGRWSWLAVLTCGMSRGRDLAASRQSVDLLELLLELLTIDQPSQPVQLRRRRRLPRSRPLFRVFERSISQAGQALGRRFATTAHRRFDVLGDFGGCDPNGNCAGHLVFGAGSGLPFEASPGFRAATSPCFCFLL